MWDERYSTEDYAYGKTANTFLQQYAQHLGSGVTKGKVLSLAEGEGRNAVFLAQQGYEVTAVDGSLVGLQKAQRLAAEQGVSIACIHADLNEFDPGEAQWDAIISIFCPMPPALRHVLFPRIIRGLKPGGAFLLEAYTPQQLAFGTGGGNDASSMLNREILSTALAGFTFQHLTELERDVVEGQYHTGRAAVVQVLARKPVSKRA